MRERITWPPSLWVLVLALDISILLSVGVALDDQGLLIALVLLLAFTLYFWWSTRLELSIDDETLFVGGAKIELRYVGEVIPLDKDAMRYERGVGLNSRAFLAIRFWVKTGVKLVLDDSRDPTPYWLVSTRKAKEMEELFKTL